MRHELKTFDALCVSTPGSSHVRAGAGCEDYGIADFDEVCAVFAVADGHGDASCSRSAYGSRVACEVAVSELKTFIRSLQSTPLTTHGEGELDSGTWEKKLLDAGEAGPLIRQLVTSIVGNWQDAVLGDYEDHPLTEDEMKDAASYAGRYARGERIEHMYGTTLIAGLLTERWLLLLQQGDGRCVVLGADGSISQPIPWDEKCFANVTTSLCDEDASDRFRSCVIDVAKSPIIACFAATDGVDDSFYSNSQLESFYSKLLCRVADGSEKDLASSLENRLLELSEKGSGDDATVCAFVSASALVEAVPWLRRIIETADLEGELARIEERLVSMEGKKAFLEKEVDTAVANEEKAAEELNGTWAVYNDFAQDEIAVAPLGNEAVSLAIGLSMRTVPWLKRFVRSNLEEAERRLQGKRDALQWAVNAREAAQTEYQAYLKRYDELSMRKGELTSLLSDMSGTVQIESASEMPITPEGYGEKAGFGNVPVAHGDGGFGS